MPNRSAERIEFGRFGLRVIEVDVSGGDQGSDGRPMMLRRIDAHWADASGGGRFILFLDQ